MWSTYDPVIPEVHYTIENVQPLIRTYCIIDNFLMVNNKFLHHPCECTWTQISMHLFNQIDSESAEEDRTSN